MSKVEPLLEIDNISKVFSLGRKRKLRALSEVSLVVYPGETLGIVGESGCGKSTLARIVMGIYEPTSGEIRYRGSKVNLNQHEARLKYAENVQMIFQDTYSSLDPRMTVEAIIAENLEIQGRLDVPGRHERVHELLEMVGLPADAANRYPHEFSGGQRQRIGIARALALQPELILCDEPISALDMSIQSQVMNLLIDLKESLNLTYVFIAHDLNMVRYISDRIAVLYDGCLVELAEAEELYTEPLHPYTKLLLSTALVPEPSKVALESMEGVERADRVQEGGCSFYARCPRAMEQCARCAPELKQEKQGHYLACHLKIASES